MQDTLYGAGYQQGADDAMRGFGRLIQPSWEPLYRMGYAAGYKFVQVQKSWVRKY